jgi:hypothetical protein
MIAPPPSEAEPIRCDPTATAASPTDGQRSEEAERLEAKLAIADERVVGLDHRVEDRETPSHAAVEQVAEAGAHA